MDTDRIRKDPSPRVGDWVARQVSRWRQRGQDEMTLRHVFLGLLLLVACGDSSSGGGYSPGGGTAQGGNSAGGAGEGGASGGETVAGGATDGGSGEGGSGEGGGAATLLLEIAGDPLASVDCATYVAGTWSTALTSFDANGEVTNFDCALVAVVVDGAPFWITSRDFEGTVGALDLQHAFSTAEAAVAIGTEPLELDDAELVLLFSGVLEVLALDGDTVEIHVHP